MSETPSQRWARLLAGWAIPEAILAQAEDEPWEFPLEMFRAGPPQESISRSRALEALPEGGSLLDVGAGGGAASLALIPPAQSLCAIDENPRMLELLRSTAVERGVSPTLVQGSWPTVARQVPRADLVLSHHVLYNVPDLIPFVRELSAKARSRVVVEITQRHPLVPLNPLWQHFYGLERPEGPDLDDALAVIQEAGIRAQAERFTRLSRLGPDHDDIRLTFTRLRLCLPKRREEELRSLLPEGEEALSREVACIWWDP